MKSILIAVLLFAVVSSAYADIWTNCGTAGDEFKVSNVSIVPDPPVKGQNITVGLKGTMSKQITSGDIHLNVKYDIITILNKDLPLCSELKCPIAAGEFTFHISDPIPSDAPSGTYTATATVTDQANAEIACAKVQPI